jgi:hypothetical protein
MFTMPQRLDTLATTGRLMAVLVALVGVTLIACNVTQDAPVAAPPRRFPPLPGSQLAHRL